MVLCRLAFAAFLAAAVSAQTDSGGGPLFSAVQRGASADVERLLHRVEENLRILTETLTLKYLVHSGTAQQITDEGELSS